MCLWVLGVIGEGDVGGYLCIYGCWVSGVKLVGGGCWGQAWKWLEDGCLRFGGQGEGVKGECL